MKRLKSLLLLVACLLAMVGCGKPTVVEVHADPPLAPTLGDLINASTFIVVGKIDKVKPSRMDEYDLYAITESEIKVDEVLKGPVAKGDTLTMRQPGGTVKGVKFEYKRVYYVQSGHKYLLFLKQWDDGTIAQTAYLQSQYELHGNDEMIFLGAGTHRETFTVDTLRERLK
ncbi:MAG: hypothetical protein K0R39_1734 [Symbiobacteriaceae bacterium]|nr:hypothetical protein [Symbiobacteriaceae bacterium]